MHGRCTDCCPAVPMCIDANERARRVDELLLEARLLRAALDRELERARRIRGILETRAAAAARPPTMPWDGERDGPD